MDSLLSRKSIKAGLADALEPSGTVSCSSYNDIVTSLTIEPERAVTLDEQRLARLFDPSADKHPAGRQRPKDGAPDARSGWSLWGCRGQGRVPGCVRLWGPLDSLVNRKQKKTVHIVKFVDVLVDMSRTNGWKHGRGRAAGVV